jgi:hypothetical protein
MSAPLFSFYDCKDSGVVEIVWCVADLESLL